MKILRRLASEISEMLACEWGHCSDKDIQDSAVKIVGDVYTINHYLTSRCCFHPTRVWNKYKGEYKGWYGKEKYKYWNAKINKIIKYKDK